MTAPIQCLNYSIFPLPGNRGNVYTTGMTSYPFDCDKCDQQPVTAFTQFEPVQDYFIAYPAENLMHIHFGFATHNDAENMAEAKVIESFFMDTFVRYPDKKFFVFVDFSRGDDSEFVPPAAMKIYRKILDSPQTGDGIVYGMTPGLSMLMKLLLFATHRQNIKAVETKQEADQAYERWKQLCK